MYQRIDDSNYGSVAETTKLLRVYAAGLETGRVMIHKLQVQRSARPDTYRIDVTATWRKDDETASATTRKIAPTPTD